MLKLKSSKHQYHLKQIHLLKKYNTVTPIKVIRYKAIYLASIKVPNKRFVFNLSNKGNSPLQSSTENFTVVVEV